MAGNKPRYVVLVPGADSLTFEEDCTAAIERGFSVVELTLPPFAGHPIDDRMAHFDAVADLIVDAIENIRRDMATNTSWPRRVSRSVKNFRKSRSAYRTHSGDRSSRNPTK